MAFVIGLNLPTTETLARSNPVDTLSVDVRVNAALSIT